MTDQGLEWLVHHRTWPSPALNLPTLSVTGGSEDLWRRYLIGNPLFLWRVLNQRLGLLEH